jgi:lysozyme
MINNAIISLVKRHEALRLKCYTDSLGIPTIGWGRNLKDRGISMQEADMLFRNDITDAAKAAKAVFPSIDSLCDARYAVLVDMAFNLGQSRLSQFKQMQLAIKQKDWKNAAAEMLDSNWAQQVGLRAQRLAKMMETGEWVDD